MCNRYITDRFLPDKAIDLVDEAAAKLRTEIDSMPSELDEILRRVMQLEIEREALRKETDEVSRERLGKIESELANLKEQSNALTAQWQAEKNSVGKLRDLRQQLEETRTEIDKAERAYDLNRAAELKYGKVRELESQLAGGRTGDRHRRHSPAEGRSHMKTRSPRLSAGGREYLFRS